MVFSFSDRSYKFYREDIGTIIPKDPKILNDPKDPKVLKVPKDPKVPKVLKAPKDPKSPKV